MWLTFVKDNQTKWFTRAAKVGFGQWMANEIYMYAKTTVKKRKKGAKKLVGFQFTSKIWSKQGEKKQMNAKPTQRVYSTYVESKNVPLPIAIFFLLPFYMPYVITNLNKKEAYIVEESTY